MSTTRTFKALEIIVSPDRAAAYDITDIPRWLESDMWRSMNARWRPDLLQRATGSVRAVLQLPLFHQWGGVSKGTLKFLEQWRTRGVLRYQEVAIVYDGANASPRLEKYIPTQKETA
jgi:hypothetical protein